MCVDSLSARLRVRRHSLLHLATCVLAFAVSAPKVEAQAPVAGAAARAAARVYREQHEGAILTEFAELLSLPNLATDSVNIRRNADFLVRMLQGRGFTNTRLLTVPGGPPAVYGELMQPGATKTLVLYAHYDGQPVDATKWTTPPWSPVLRTKEVHLGGTTIPIPSGSGRVDGEARIYGRSAGDDKGSIQAILSALDAMKASQMAPSVNLKVFFEGEEEAGSGHLQQILTTYAAQLTGDAWLFCDGPVHQSGRPQLSFGQRGSSGFELTLYGPTRALHSGHYGNWAPNPAMMIATLIASMRDDDGRIKIAGYYDDVKPVSAAEHRAVAELPKYDSTLRVALGHEPDRGQQRAARRTHHAARVQCAWHSCWWCAGDWIEHHRDGSVRQFRLAVGSGPDTGASATAGGGAHSRPRLLDHRR